MVTLVCKNIFGEEIMRKLPLVIIFCLICSLFLPVYKAEANGFVVSGANALKGAVISSMESTGVKFANKEAKERAFDAWNMKAYEKWKADEAAGKNADLWAHFNGETAKIAKSHVNVLPDKPGFGKLLMDATWFGMAISIGAEVGFAIENAQDQAKLEDGYLDYLSKDLKTFEGISFNNYLNVTYTTTALGQPPVPEYQRVYFIGKNVIGSVGNPYEDIATLNVTNIQVDGDYLNVTSYPTNWFELYDNKPYSRNTVYKRSVPLSEINFNKIAGGIPYQFRPTPGDRPAIAPNPYVEPLITPKPDIGSVPAIMPSPEPVPVVIPIGDPFGDNPHVEPYKPSGVDADPETNPGKEPGTDPGTGGQEPKDPDSEGEEPTEANEQSCEESDEEMEIDSDPCEGVPYFGSKLEFIFGNATGNKNHIERSLAMELQLNSIGIFDDAKGKKLVLDNLSNAFDEPSSIRETKENGRLVRVSVLTGPNGELKVESVWDKEKLISVKLGEDVEEGPGEGSGNVKFSSNLENHIKFVDATVPRRRGIGGAHNKDEFYKNEINVLNVEQHPSMSGIEKITYQVPSIDGKTGEITGWKATMFYKTVYDPIVVSDEHYIRLGKEAAQDAFVKGELGGEWTGYDSQGVKWRGYTSENGEVTSFYPEI